MATEKTKCWNKQVIGTKTPASSKKNYAWHLVTMQLDSR